MHTYQNIHLGKYSCKCQYRTPLVDALPSWRWTCAGSERRLSLHSSCCGSLWALGEADCPQTAHSHNPEEHNKDFTVSQTSPSFLTTVFDESVSDSFTCSSPRSCSASVRGRIRRKTFSFSEPSSALALLLTSGLICTRWKMHSHHRACGTHHWASSLCWHYLQRSLMNRIIVKELLWAVWLSEPTEQTVIISLGRVQQNWTI